MLFRSGIINVVTEKGGDFIFSANGYRSVLISLDNIYADDSNTIVLYKVFQAYIEAADTHGKPLKNVDVTIDGTTKTTDDEGITSFDLVRGSYRITVSYSDEVLNEDIDITNQNVLLSYSFERSIIDKKPEENGNIQLLVKAQSLSNGLTVDSSSNDFTIYWGDGTSTEGKSGSRTYSHTYEYEDYWPIEITGSENITRANSTKAYLIAYWSIGNSNVNNLTFNGFNLMNAVGDVFKNDVSRTDFSSVFNECRNLKIIYESLFSKCIEATNFGSSFAWCGLKTIPKNMFKNQNKVTNFFQAFFRCTALLSMPADTFDFCPSVTNLRQVFQNCTSLKGGYMPANDNTPNYSGMFSACDSLQFIVSKSEIPPIFDHSGIADFNVYVPDESVELYKTASVWSRFSDRIYPMSKFAIDFPEAQDN